MPEFYDNQELDSEWATYTVPTSDRHDLDSILYEQWNPITTEDDGDCGDDGIDTLASLDWQLRGHPMGRGACVESAETTAPSWRSRLTYDFSVSETSPVIKGTWVTARHIVDLIMDGWTWSDILRSHPELTEDDIRICLQYAIENDC